MFFAPHSYHRVHSGKLVIWMFSVVILLIFLISAAAFFLLSSAVDESLVVSNDSNATKETDTPLSISQEIEGALEVNHGHTSRQKSSKENILAINKSSEKEVNVLPVEIIVLRSASFQDKQSKEGQRVEDKNDSITTDQNKMIEKVVVETTSKVGKEPDEPASSIKLQSKSNTAKQEQTKMIPIKNDEVKKNIQEEAKQEIKELPIRRNISKGKDLQEEVVDFEIPDIKDDTGAFGLRTVVGRNEGVQLSGGSVASENAVDMALAWLAVHQEPDGHWDSGKHGGTSSVECDLAVTGAALLAFLSAGQTDVKGEWNLTVRTGVQWILKMQKKSGAFDKRNYANGICTMAICEAAAMGCGGEDIKKASTLAIDYILKQQNTFGCFDYTGVTKRNDMSVTGWCITALKSGALANIRRKEIESAYEKLNTFFEADEFLGDVSETSKGLAWYTQGTRGSGGAGGACQAIAMFVGQQIGRDRIEPSTWLLAAADGQIKKMPKKYSNANVYRVYYAYLTLRQLGGKHWDVWNNTVSQMIIEAQRQDGDFRGSWDPNRSSIEKAGRVMYTAFLCLCLEIYYRYPTVF